MLGSGAPEGTQANKQINKDSKKETKDYRNLNRVHLNVC
jgi:hypothetical protein